jgi:hypothetical protein
MASVPITVMGFPLFPGAGMNPMASVSGIISGFSSILLTLSIQTVLNIGSAFRPFRDYKTSSLSVPVARLAVERNGVRPSATI